MPDETLLYIVILCRLMIGLVFCISLIGKMLDFNLFVQAISNFNILPYRLHRIAAIVFIATEMAVVLLMVLGERWLLLGFLLAGTLFILFSAALSSVLIRKIVTSCNCFGPSEKTVSSYDIWRNIAFLICTGIGTLALSATEETTKGVNLIEWGLLSMVAVVFVLICLNLRDILELVHE